MQHICNIFAKKFMSILHKHFLGLTSFLNSLKIFIHWNNIIKPMFELFLKNAILFDFLNKIFIFILNIFFD